MTPRPSRRPGSGPSSRRSSGRSRPRRTACRSARGRRRWPCRPWWRSESEPAGPSCPSLPPRRLRRPAAAASCRPSPAPPAAGGLLPGRPPPASSARSPPAAPSPRRSGFDSSCAGLGELRLDGRLGVLQLVLRSVSVCEALGGLRALLGRRRPAAHGSRRPPASGGRSAGPSAGVWSKYVLRVVGEQEASPCRSAAAGAVLRGGEGAQLRARVVELLGALGDVVEQACRPCARCCVGLLLGARCTSRWPTPPGGTGRRPSS